MSVISVVVKYRLENMDGGILEEEKSYAFRLDVKDYADFYLFTEIMARLHISDLLNKRSEEGDPLLADDKPYPWVEVTALTYKWVGASSSYQPEQVIKVKGPKQLATYYQRVGDQKRRKDFEAAQIEGQLLGILNTQRG